MDPQESKARFKRADELYRAGRCKEALQDLLALNQAFPGNKNVLYPAALCYAKLGRQDQAIALCDQLIEEHDDQRAKVMKARMVTTPEPPPLPNFDFEPAAPYQTHARTGGMPNWLMYTLLGLAVLVAILILGVMVIDA